VVNKFLESYFSDILQIERQAAEDASPKIQAISNPTACPHISKIVDVTGKTVENPKRGANGYAYISFTAFGDSIDGNRFCFGGRRSDSGGRRGSGRSVCGPGRVDAVQDTDDERFYSDAEAADGRGYKHSLFADRWGQIYRVCRTGHL
jgi:hypothetical protein